MSRSMMYPCLTLLLALGAPSGCTAGDRDPEATETWSDSLASSFVAGDYVIHSVANNKCVDTAGASTADGARVQIWDCNATGAQRFNIAPTSDGYWKIINVKSGKGLDIQGASTQANAPVQQWSYVGGNHQQFKIVARGNNRFSIQARHTDMAVDLYWGRPDNGTGFVQYPYTGTSNQLYTFEKVGGPVGTGCLDTRDGNTTLRFINRCPFRVDFAGNNIPGGLLGSGDEACRTIGANTAHMISKRYWGFREGNDPGNEHHSLAEFGFNEVFHGYTSWDWFNLSYVDANNLPLKIVPYEIGGGNTCASQTRSCPMDMLTNCPEVGKLRNAAGEVIACVSHDRDNPSSPVARYFDATCSQAYSWSGDNSAMAACNAGDFDIVFCPES